MISSRAVGVSVLGVVLVAPAVRAQTAAHYRDFQLGGDIASVAALTGVAASAAKADLLAAPRQSKASARQAFNSRGPFRAHG